MMSRPLIPSEERALVRYCRRLGPRNRLLIIAQLFLGFRISEILALQVRHVFERRRVRPCVALAPRFLKGGYGGTRSVPVGAELARSIECWTRRRGGSPGPKSPLFPSRQGGGIGRSSAEKIIKRALLAVCDDTVGLSSHTLRKTWARRLYHESGHDLLVVRDGLGHASVATTQRYLAVARERVAELIARSD